MTERGENLGEIKIRLCKLLSEHGIKCDPDDFYSLKGKFVHSLYDGNRWMTFATFEGRRFMVESFYTMKECVRNGIEIDVDRLKYEIEVKPVQSEARTGRASENQ